MLGLSEEINPSASEISYKVTFLARDGEIQAVETSCFRTVDRSGETKSSAKPASSDHRHHLFLTNLSSAGYQNLYNMGKGDLSGQIALVTGATGGIGTSICRLLAYHGCSVAMHYNSDQDSAIGLLEEFKEEFMHAYGSKFVAYKADMGNYEEVSTRSLP